MSEFETRVKDIGQLYVELGEHVTEGQWRLAAEIAGALELDLDALRERLRARHREEMHAARKRGRSKRLAQLRSGAPAGLRRWRARREALAAAQADDATTTTRA